MRLRLERYADERDGLFYSTGAYLHAFGHHEAEQARAGMLG